MEDSKKNFTAYHDAYLRQYIQQADTKSSWLFAASSTISLWIVSNDRYASFLKGEPFSWNAALILLPLVLLLVSCFFAFNAIRPRSRTAKAKGIVYFSNVANYDSPEDYIEAVEACSDGDIFRERLKAQYHMSKICAQKYECLYYGSYTAVAGITLVAVVHIVFLFT
ncbi:Pycsar system effector family protein [Rhizobium sp. CSW-27]|uniref:Pycsar system effector family protein n=1 Tax=Rhizobium sp. CSW-27 TaxID=2839985 RepID=UPI001C02AF98|nr:Pycsar system effector family protein [Rhizobium sp. CSW-27]MBT9371976.1 hypothetical protein [Rhizobium sp. CSW-27]